MDLIAAYRRLRSRVDVMIARAVIARVNDAMRTQRLQLSILTDEVDDDVEHLQPYGVSFHPPAGSEAVVLAVGGARSHSVAICAQSPDARPQDVPEGCGGLYTGGEWRLFIDETGIVHLGTNPGVSPVVLATPLAAAIGTFDAALSTFAAAVGTFGAAVNTFGQLCTGPSDGQKTTLATASTTMSTAATTMAAACTALTAAMPATAATKVTAT